MYSSMYKIVLLTKMNEYLHNNTRATEVNINTSVNNGTPILKKKLRLQVISSLLNIWRKRCHTAVSSYDLLYFRTAEVTTLPLVGK
jgi:hypothetical protein